jgi:heptosyltransferase-2
MILTTPLLERLAEDGPVHVLATPANAGILANHPAVASVIVFDKRGQDRGWGGMQRMARALRDTGAKRAYMAQGSLRTAAIARLAGIPERIGFDTSPGRVLYTRQVHFDASQHHVERLWRLAEPASFAEATRDVERTVATRTETDRTPRRPSLYPGPADRAQVERLLAEVGHEVAPFIALAPGSVWATKRWPSYDDLAAELTSAIHATSMRIAVIGGDGDRELADAIVAKVASHGGPAVIDAVGRLSLLASADLISRAAVLVTNDSAPLHLASAMNTPTIALFGPTVTSLGFGPLADIHRVVEQAALSCRPCGAHGARRCPLGHWKCMRDTSVKDVADSLVPLLRSR